jgi:hypothetical protein
MGMVTVHGITRGVFHASGDTPRQRKCLSPSPCKALRGSARGPAVGILFAGLGDPAGLQGGRG